MKEFAPALIGFDIDVMDKGTEYVVTAEIAGVEKSDCKVKVKNNILAIDAHKRKEICHDDSTPNVDDLTPDVDDSIPHVDDSIPHVDNSTPHVDDSTPHVDDSTPHVDDLNPPGLPNDDMTDHTTEPDVTTDIAHHGRTDVTTPMVNKGKNSKSHSQLTKRNRHQCAHIVSEIHYGHIHRSLRLPNDANTKKIRCTLDKGVLSIHIPKMTPAEQVSDEISIE